VARRQTDELVDQIRLKRHRIARATGLSDLVDRTVGVAHRHPVLWIVAGTTAGAISAGLFGPALLRMSQGVAKNWLRSAIKGGVVSLARDAVRSKPFPGTRSEVSATWEDAPPAGEDSTGADPPLQASGGPVSPLRGS
jgi:hypothetical protein